MLVKNKMPKHAQIARRAPGRPVASEGHEARELLLNAAVELFADEGIAGTTFVMVAKKVGLTPAMMHYYFKNRDQLLDAVVEERMALLISGVWNPIQSGQSPAEMIQGLVGRLLEGIERMRWIPPVWIREVLNERGLLRSRMMRHIPRDRVRIFCEAVTRGQQRKAINPDIDPLLLVFSMLGLVMLHCATLRSLDEIFQRGRVSSEVLEKHITGLILRGLTESTAHGKTAISKSSRRTRNA